MHQLNNYDVYIFDCDGVILDSNKLKIQAMEESLYTIFSDKRLIDDCLDYFRKNFGKSRFHHVAFFIDSIFEINKTDINDISNKILDEYSRRCYNLYLTAELTPGIIEFLNCCNGKKYIASGSEQEELRQVFATRGLDIYFDNIFGSPVTKSKLIKDILATEQNNCAVMFGDAISDFESAIVNKIDFVYYAPYSNVKDYMNNLSKKENFLILNSWKELC